MMGKSYEALKQEVNAAIANVLSSGWYILGREVSLFEHEFSSYCAKGYGVGVASGTDALHLALRAYEIGDGDEVITVANTAVPTILAIMHAGARPVFVDINEKNYTMDVSHVADKITRRTRAILPVHLYGHPADMDSIGEIAKDHGLAVIEDCAQAHGTEYKQRKVPVSETGCFSFYPTKNLGAYGDAGMVLTDNKAIADRIRLLRNCGHEKNYVHPVKGYNSRLDELQAAVLRIKLKHLDDWNRIRRANAQLYNKMFDSTNIITPREESYARHTYHQYVIRVKKRDRVIETLNKIGISLQVHYPLPVHMQKAFSDLGLEEGELPVTEKLSKEILSLPVLPEISKDMLNKIGSFIRNFATQNI